MARACNYCELTFINGDTVARVSFECSNCGVDDSHVHLLCYRMGMHGPYSPASMRQMLKAGLS